MDLNDLKKTWDKMSTTKELDENELRSVLSTRTSSLIERIDRNVKVGFIVLLGLIILFSLDFGLSPQTVEESYKEMPIPDWLTNVAIFCNLLIVCIFIYFLAKYYFVKRKCKTHCSLKDTLKQYIETLVTYKRLFYLALMAILLAIGSAFVSGMFIGTEYNAISHGMQMSDIGIQQILIIVLITVAFLALIGGGIFLFLRWGFQKLYGNYITKLKATLKELEEIDM